MLVVTRGQARACACGDNRYKGRSVDKRVASLGQHAPLPRGPFKDQVLEQMLGVTEKAVWNRAAPARSETSFTASCWVLATCLASAPLTCTSRATRAEPATYNCYRPPTDERAPVLG